MKTIIIASLIISVWIGVAILIALINKKFKLEIEASEMIGWPLFLPILILLSPIIFLSWLIEKINE